jgi:NACHT domain
VSQKINLTKLPQAVGAGFDSYEQQLDARCHPETRVQLRQQIKEWADNSQGKCIFWLCGMAGTGKSTISRTVAQSFADKGQLAASFFFKRGGGDRGNARRFFTTIARQLVVKVPLLSSIVSEAVEADPSLPVKSMKEQFENLILQPLLKVPAQKYMLRLLLVIDALDECENEGDIRIILYLLAQFQSVASVSLRVFVTSRPETPIRLGFKAISGGSYQDMILHEIPRPIVEHDIAAFLKHEFGKIRDNHQNLPSDWPGEKNLHALTDIATPLFIIAATVCRFIGDTRWDPEEQLRVILTYQTATQASKLDQIYSPILERLLANQIEPQKETVIREFILVIGTILLLANPLSAISLARLLGISEMTVICTLDPLHSVLNIPTDQHSPVRLIHGSFRNFLIDPQKKNTPFWIDATKTHMIIATQCLKLMSDYLKQNICCLQSPGTLQVEIDRTIIGDNLPAEIQYACCHWVYHLEHSGSQISDYDTVHSFLSEHLLHWLEALSLVGRPHESIAMIPSLITLIKVNLLLL